MIKKTKIFTQLVTGALIGMIAAITLCFSSCKEKVIPAIPIFYKVTFDTQGGSPIDHKEVKPGSSITLPAPPRKAGATFDGWFTDKEAKNLFSETTAINADLTLYAKWNEQLYTVTFDITEGDSPIINSSIGVKYGNTIIFPPEPTRANYLFDGWYADEEANSIPFSPTTPITDNITLYARWVNFEQLPVFRLFSKTIKKGRQIPYKHRYFGENISPHMGWANAPKKTKSFILIMESVYNPTHRHWTVYAIPADKRSLAENDPWLSKEVQGAYRGPYWDATDPIKEQTYQFIIYALDVDPNYFNDNNYPKSSKEAKEKLDGHILASANIVATYWYCCNDG